MGSSMQRWEYRIETWPLMESGGSKPLKETLNKAGSQGWELVNVVGVALPPNGVNDPGNFKYIFKRLVTDPSEAAKP